MDYIPNRTTKIGRNEPCPCGSGNKFKRCHGSDSPPLTMEPGRIDDRKKQLAPRQVCMIAEGFRHECSKGTVAAHTVSRSGSLGAIQRGGHVYSFKITQQTLHKSGGKLAPQLIGWKSASTFPGFCPHHDKKVFAPLEDEPFIGTSKQCFLLAYRAVAWELYTKLASYAQSPLRHALSLGKPYLKDFAEAFNFGVELGLRDTKAFKAAYDAVLEQSRWNAVRGMAFEFDAIFPIQCTGAFSPGFDINGTAIQDLDETVKAPDVISIMSFAAGGRSYLCLCWLEQRKRLPTAVYL